MHQAAWRYVGLFGLLTLTACGGSYEQRATADLNNRLQASLAADIAAGNARVQPLPDGARVTLTPPFSGATWGVGQDSRVSTVQSQLNPELERIELANQAPQDVALAETLAILDWKSVTRVDPAIAPPGGVVVTIHVVCPDVEPIDGGAGCR